MRHIKMITIKEFEKRISDIGFPEMCSWVAMTRIPIEPEDAVQDGLIEAMTSLDNYQDNNFKDWLRSIIINTAKDSYKLQSRQRRGGHITQVPYLEVYQIPDSDSPESIHIANEQEDVFKKSYESLSPGLAEAFDLFYLQDKTLKEVSDILNISTNAVKTRTNRASKILKKLID